MSAIPGIVTNTPCEAAFKHERHECIEIPDFVMRPFIPTPLVYPWMAPFLRRQPRRFRPAAPARLRPHARMPRMTALGLRSAMFPAAYRISPRQTLLPRLPPARSARGSQLLTQTPSLRQCPL